MCTYSLNFHKLYDDHITKSTPNVNYFYPYYEPCLAFASVNNEGSPGPSYFPSKASLAQGRSSISTKGGRFSES